MTLLWPIKRLRAQNVAFDIAPRTLAGPSSVSGFTQVVSSDAGIWKATLGNIVIKSRDEVLAFRAISALLEGRLTPILVPLCRGYQPITAGADYTEVPHSDDAYFDDDTGYVGSGITVVLASSAAARASSLTVTVTTAGQIEPGQHFSLGERLYRVRTFDSDTGTMTIRPLLREAASAGDALNFDNPVCRMRLASDSEMDLEISMRKYGAPTVNFIEDL